MRKAMMIALLGIACIVAPARAETLRFVAAPLPPLVIDQDGKPDGAVLVVLRELSEKMGNPFSVEFLPQTRALTESQRNTGIGFAGMTRNAERESLYKWVGPLISDSIVLITKKGKMPIPATLVAAKDWRVGVMRGSATVPVLQKAGFTNIEEQKDAETGARMLQGDRIDAWASSKLASRYLYRSLGFDPATLDIGAEVRRNDVYLGVSKDVSDETITAWQTVLDQMRAKGRIDEITKSFSQ